MAKTKKNTQIKQQREEPLGQLEDVQRAMRLAVPRVRRLERRRNSLLEEVLERPEALNRLKQEWSPEELAMAKRQIALPALLFPLPAHYEKGGQSMSLGGKRRNQERTKHSETC